MAISTRTNPELIVNGVVTNTREIKRKQGENTGEVLGVNITVETAGGKLQVTSWDRNPAPQVVEAIGTRVALVVSVDEGARGANLTFERMVNDNDLDRIGSDLSALSATAGK